MVGVSLILEGGAALLRWIISGREQDSYIFGDSPIVYV